MVSKIIWTYWDQGWSQAPGVAQLSLRSWTSLNPDYEVRALDRSTLLAHVELPGGIDLDRKDLTVQKIAALGRLALLAKYGGVWTDATVVCTKPLESWLGEYYDSTFFAFRSPGKDRLMSNWFIASDSNNVILRRLYRDFTDLFANNYFAAQNTPLGKELIDRYTSLWCSDVETTVEWFSPYALNELRVYPYFIFHYTFNRLILADPECAALWKSAKPFPAEPPHRLQAFAGYADGADRARREVESRECPMYKLDWRVDTASAYWSAVLEHLEPKP